MKRKNMRGGELSIPTKKSIYEWFHFTDNITNQPNFDNQFRFAIKTNISELNDIDINADVNTIITRLNTYITGLKTQKISMDTWRDFRTKLTNVTEYIYKHYNIPLPNSE